MSKRKPYVTIGVLGLSFFRTQFRLFYYCKQNPCITVTLFLLSSQSYFSFSMSNLTWTDISPLAFIYAWDFYKAFLSHFCSQFSSFTDSHPQWRQRRLLCVKLSVKSVIKKRACIQRRFYQTGISVCAEPLSPLHTNYSLLQLLSDSVIF